MSLRAKRSNPHPTRKFLRQAVKYVRAGTRTLWRVRGRARCALDLVGLQSQPYDIRVGSAVCALRPRSGDLDAVVENFVLDQYRLARFATLPLRTIVDLGAHIGTFVLQAATTFPQSRLVAVEPHPENFRQLAQNVARNDLQHRVQLICGAVTAQSTREVTLFTGSDHTGHSCVFPSSERLTVPNIPPDALRDYAAGPALLKVDIQGEERNLFVREFRDLFRAFVVVIVETHARGEEDTTDSLQSFLREEGIAFERDGYLFWMQPRALARNESIAFPRKSVRPVLAYAAQHERVASNH